MTPDQITEAITKAFVDAIAAGRLVGRTEADVAREVRERLIAEGHDEAHFAIVGSGPNSASPHHEASDRVIEAGEPIVLDIGGTIGGTAYFGGEMLAREGEIKESQGGKG